MSRWFRHYAGMMRDEKLCKRGHPLSGSNLYQRSGGPRVCKTCRKMHKLKHREKANA